MPSLGNVVSIEGVDVDEGKFARCIHAQSHGGYVGKIEEGKKIVVAFLFAKRAVER